LKTRISDPWFFGAKTLSVKEDEMRYSTYIAFLAFFALTSGNTLAASGEKEYTKPTHAKAKFQIPASCIMKAQAMATVTAMSGTDRSASLSFVSVLSAVGSSIVVDYNLIPKLIQKGSNQNDAKGSDRGNGNNKAADNQGMTEISLTGSLGAMQISLADVNGTAISITPVYVSQSDAQSQTTATTVSASLVQMSNNQATINLGLIGSDIRSFYTHLSFHSELLNQATASGMSIAGVTTNPTTGIPFAQAHAITLADIVTSINVKTVVRFDGTSLTLDTPKIQIGC
jgi:hypothetical protein